EARIVARRLGGRRLAREGAVARRRRLEERQQPPGLVVPRTEPDINILSRRTPQGMTKPAGAVHQAHGEARKGAERGVLRVVALDVGITHYGVNRSTSRMNPDAPGRTNRPDRRRGP